MSILCVVLIIINFIIIGGGHGYFEPLFFSFPFATLILLVFDKINLVVIFLFFIQFLIYGYVLDLNKENLRKTSILLLIIHVISGIIAIQFMPLGFK